MYTTRILIIDDQAIIRNGIKQILAEAGYENFLDASDGLAALSQLKAHPDIDLVLTDSNMPRGMDGLSLLKSMQETYPRIPTIMISGNSNPEFVESVKKLGAVGFISKPVIPSELLGLIAQQLKEKDLM